MIDLCIWICKLVFVAARIVFTTIMVEKYLRDFSHLFFLILTVHLMKDVGDERIYPSEDIINENISKKTDSI